MSPVGGGEKPRIFTGALLAGMAIFELPERLPDAPGKQRASAQRRSGRAVMLASLGLGLAVGVILALTGAGGGILAVPLLVFGMQMGVAGAGPIGLLAVGMPFALALLFVAFKTTPRMAMLLGTAPNNNAQ